MAKKKKEVKIEEVENTDLITEENNLITPEVTLEEDSKNNNSLVEEVKNVKITSEEVQIVSSIKLDFQGLYLKANEKYNFTRDAFEEIKKEHPNIEVFIERGVVIVE